MTRITFMTDFGKKHQKISGVRTDSHAADDVLNRSESWQAISQQIEKYDNSAGNITRDIIFNGKVLQGGNFSGEDLQNADFSGCNMREINLSKANLQNVNFTGADLSGADFSGANLDGAVFTGAKLIGVNFSGAKMHGVRLVNADLQDAIFTDADLDNLTIEELQEIVEYLAKYYPHKLNLARMNLTLLDLKRIDLRQVSLRGVDLRGCDLTGVNIYELDLSECLISPEQIAQAIGHIPTPEELKKILAPKKGKNKKKMKGIDFGDLFDSRGGFTWDTTKSGTDMKKMLKMGKDFIDSFKKGGGKGTENPADDKQDAKDAAKKENDIDELRKSIEQHKREVLEQRKEQQKAEENEQQKAQEREQTREKIHEAKMQLMQNSGRDR